MAVKVKTTKGSYSYPDIVVVCNDAVFSRTTDGKSQLENPVLIIEVLSVGSPQDLGDKFEEYKAIESLIEYIVIHQDCFKVSYHLKSTTKSWITREAIGENSLLFLRSIGLAIRLNEIYEKVTF